MLKKFFTLSSILLMVVMFQNCGQQHSSSDSFVQAVDGVEAPIDTGLACPIYNRPICEQGEVAIVLTNEHGCSYPVCQKDKVVTSCPEYNRPLCDKGEGLVTDFDENNCPFPQCKTKSEVGVCPDYMRPQCSENENLVTVKDSNSCPMPVCE